MRLETLLVKNTFLLGPKVSMVDIAIFPFIRQFAAVDAEWFDSSRYAHLKLWLQVLVSSDLFCKVMEKNAVYSAAGS